MGEDKSISRSNHGRPCAGETFAVGEQDEVTRWRAGEEEALKAEKAAFN